MNKNSKKTFNSIMRSLHRDVAFITIGFTIVYALSGMLLVYRNTDFMKQEKYFEKNIVTEIPAGKLGAELGIRGLEVTNENDGIFYFTQGSYNSMTGEAKFTKKVYPKGVDKMVDLHKLHGKNKLHWISTLYGGMLFFLAFSAFFIYNKGSKLRKRSFIMVTTSIVLLLGVIFFL